MKEKLIIEEFEGLYSLYNEGGICIEADFETYEDAKNWAIDAGYAIVASFFL